MAAVVTLDVSRDVYIAAEIDGLTSFFVQNDDGDGAAKSAFSLRGNLLLGKRW